ncbi:MAG: hypothetical protein IT453_18505 [Planctomycetes bacterium]|nr:hypothetical protein [Planctomycetota bacterium]
MGHEHGTHHDHAEHDLEHEASEAFPRRLLASIVAGDELQSRARARWQAVCLAIGLAVLALAFPTRVLMGDGPEFVRACDSGAWVVVHLALAPLARLVALLPGLGIEQGWFVISALSWGVCAVASWKSLVRFGSRARAALVAALVTLGAPAAWLSATLPGGAAPGLLGAWLVFGSLLDAQHQPDREHRHRKVALAFGLALLLDVRALTYAPAILAEAWSTARERREGSERVVRRAIALVVALAAFVAVFAFAAFVLPSSPEGWGFVGRALDGLAGRGPGGIGSLWLALFGVGTAAAGLVVLARKPLDAEERRPPVWIAVWCVAPLVLPILYWNIDAHAVLAAFLPPAALGLASWLANYDWKALVQYTTLLVAGQFAVGVPFVYAIGSRDPNLAWKARAVQELLPGDVLLTLEPDHAYLARHRFALEVVDLAEPLALEAEARDAWWRALGERLRTVTDAGGRAAFDLADGGQDYGCRAELLRLRTQVPYTDL